MEYVSFLDLEWTCEGCPVKLKLRELTLVVNGKHGSWVCQNCIELIKMVDRIGADR